MALTLDQKLEKARESAKSYGKLRGRKETADDLVKGVYALLYPEAPGDTVGERDAWVKRQEKYKQAVQEKESRFSEWAAAELWMKLLFAEVEKYRTDKSFAKHIDKAHE